MTVFSWVDYIILGIFFLSTLAGLFRGLVKEIMLLCTWIIGLILAIKFSAPLAAVFTHSEKVQSAISSATASMTINPQQQISWIAIAISFIVIFVATLIIGTIISSMFSRAVDSTGLGWGNRLLGGCFGFGRGFLVNLVLIFLIQLIPGMQDETWWNQSPLVNKFQPAVAWLGNIVQPGFESFKTKMGDKLQDVTGTLQNATGQF